MRTDCVEKLVNLTLSADERVAEGARKAALAMGKSLNQAVRDYLEQLARTAPLETELQAFEASARATPGRLAGWNSIAKKPTSVRSLLDTDIPV